VEYLVALVDTRVGVAGDGLQHPLGILELHLLLLLNLWADLLFALLLTGMHAFMTQLLLHLFTIFLCELLDFPALLDVVVPGVVHRAPCATVVVVLRLMGVLVIVRVMAPTSCYSSSSSGCPGQQLVIIVVASLLLLLLAAVLISSTRIGLACLLCLWGGWRMLGTALCGPSALVHKAEERYDILDVVRGQLL
jgi:hypothetical protein